MTPFILLSRLHAVLESGGYNELYFRDEETESGRVSTRQSELSGDREAQT